MASVFRNHMSVSFYRTDLGEDLQICEAGFEECSPTKPYEFIPIDYYALHYCIRGEGIVAIKGREEHIHPGGLFIIPPHTKNKYYPVAENPWCYRWVGIRGNMAGQLLSMCALTEDHFFIHHQVQPELEYYFEKIYDACIEEQEMQAMGNLFLLLDNLRAVQEGRLHALLTSPEKLYQDTLRYIHQNYFQNISVEQMAQEYHVDRTYLFRLYKKYQNSSPSQYLLEYRLDQACMLLRKSSMTITQISNAVGFQNISYFTRQFSRIRGITPSAYRKQFMRTVCLGAVPD